MYFILTPLRTTVGNFQAAEHQIALLTLGSACEVIVIDRVIRKKLNAWDLIVYSIKDI